MELYPTYLYITTELMSTLCSAILKSPFDFFASRGLTLWLGAGTK